MRVQNTCTLKLTLTDFKLVFISWLMFKDSVNCTIVNTAYLVLTTVLLATVLIVQLHVHHS